MPILIDSPSCAKWVVVGTGVVGSIFKPLDDFDVVHHSDWKELLQSRKAVIDCSGLAGWQTCNSVPFYEVLKANVALPLTIAEACQESGIPFVTMSTMAVYRMVQGKAVKEDFEIFPQNAYVGSKILMELCLLNMKCFIFRLARVIGNDNLPRSFANKIKKWKVVEDVMESILYPHTLVEAVKNAVSSPNPEYGIYNIASETVHLPTFIKNRYGWEGEVIPAGTLKYGASVEFDTTKAYKAGLLYNDANFYSKFRAT